MYKQKLEILLNDRSIDLVTIYIKTDERIRLKRCIDRDTHLSIDEIYKKLIQFITRCFFFIKP